MPTDIFVEKAEGLLKLRDLANSDISSPQYLLFFQAAMAFYFFKKCKRDNSRNEIKYSKIICFSLFLIINCIQYIKQKLYSTLFGSTKYAI